MRLIDADKLMDNLRGNVLVDVTPALEDAVAEQPTVRQWIPVSERLPDESGYYCVTTVDTETDVRIEQTIWFAHEDDYSIDNSEWRELADYEKVLAWRKSDPYLGIVV